MALMPMAEAKQRNCISFSGTLLEQLVSEEALTVVEPAAISAAEQAERLFCQQQTEREQSLSNSLKQAEYEADHCFDQYNSVDPKNRLVALNLETLWNDALKKVEKIRQRLVQLKNEYQPLTQQQRDALFKLADDLPNVWNHAQTDIRLKKRILQTLINEIVVDIDANNNDLKTTIHWAGGKHTQHRIKRKKRGERFNHLHPDTENIIRSLAEIVADHEIARILNLLKIKTASGKTWNVIRVSTFRRKHNIPKCLVPLVS